MASYHHHYHHHPPTHPKTNHIPSPFNLTSSRCCPCDTTPCCAQPQPQPGSPLHPDQLLQAIASYLQQQQEQQNYCSYQAHLFANSLRTQNSFQGQRVRQQKHRVLQRRQHCQPREYQTQFVLSDLLRRLDALESSLEGLSRQTDGSCCSLRDAAARVIQMHFRAFLVRRSRGLRNLKELANVKSSFQSLRSSILGKTRFSFEAVSQKAVDLLLKLDSIQGGDPMVSDGKKSLTRDLLEFLEYIEDCAIRRTEVLCRAAKHVRFAGNGNNGGASKVLGPEYGGSVVGRRETMEKLRERIEKLGALASKESEDSGLEALRRMIDDSEGNPKIIITRKNSKPKTKSVFWMKGNGGQPKMKKTVRFDEDGPTTCKVYAYGNTTESNTSEEENSNDENVAGDDDETQTQSVYLDVEEIKRHDDDEEAETENGSSSSQGSNRGTSPSRNTGHGVRTEVNGGSKIRSRGIVFSAPLPVKMEP